MIARAKYGHTNLIAKDWRALARFYEEQFGCTAVPPERASRGDLERGRASGSELQGAHLRCRATRWVRRSRLQLQHPDGKRTSRQPSGVLTHCFV